MRAARLYGPADLRLVDISPPAAPGAGQALLRVKAVGICGSDLHTYMDGRIGDTVLKSPIIPGHEFAGVVEAVGDGAVDGEFKPLLPGTPVAVDPAQPCEHCEQCERGHPNLCLNLRFCGLYPDDGALCELMLVPGRTCFPVARGMDFGEATLLETIGVALHAVDLAHVRVGDSLAILGAGPVGLCILQVARLAGAGPIFVSDKFPWRLDLARKLGAIPICCDSEDVVAAVLKATHSRGVDLAIEAAWADHSVQQATEMARNGGRLVLVGIPGDDRLMMKHSTARRKGLTIRMARRMKHVYPRAIELHRRRAVDLKSLISHRFPLAQSAEAFTLNAKYAPGVVKVIIDV